VARHIHYTEWHIHPFRADRWFQLWRPALDRAPSYGARSCVLTRDGDDPLHFRQMTTWEDPADYERWWFSDEVSAIREAAFNYYNKPVITTWHSLVADAAVVAAE
jgi:quinol monooxygenase YgiN